MKNKQKISREKGTLIVFEGIDGTGKSTQLKLLAEHLSRKGYSVIETREPTEGTYGQKIRSLYQNRDKATKEEELNLFLQDRSEHVENLINPALFKGKIILCDRYYLSTIAYQGAAGMNIKEILEKNSFAPEPDLALIFQLPPHLSIKRITQKRGDTLNDFEQEESLLRVENIFNSLDFPYIYYIDADQTIEKVHEAVTNVVDKYLNNQRIGL